MERDTDKDWTKIAETNPYWGVLSNSKFRGVELKQEHKPEFFSSGERLVSDTLGFVQRHMISDFRIRRALDFGCGVGRLLIPLARVADEAIGVDVAPRMLELAEINLASSGVSNASVILDDDSLMNVSGSFNFVMSYIVLQHISPERGLRCLQSLLRVLEVGGVFSIQLTYAKERRFFSHETNAARYYRREGDRIHDLCRTTLDGPDILIKMFDYDLNDVMLRLAEVSGEPLLILPTNHDGHLGFHFIGQKARTEPSG